MQSVRLAKPSSPSIQALLDRAIAFHEAGQLEHAEHLYRSILARDPQHAETLRLIGLVHTSRGQFSEAVAFLSASVTSRPTFAQGHFSLGNGLFAQNQFAEAAASFRKAIEHQPNYPDAYCNLGNALASTNLFGEAIVAYERALKLNPRSAEVYCSLGIVFRKAGQTEKAIQACQSALKLNPRYADVVNNLGLIYQGQKRHDAALLEFRRALTLKPAFPEALYNLAHALEENGQSEPAFQAYLEALKLKPNYAEVFLGLGRIVASRQRWDEARQIYQQCLVLRPDYTEAWNNIGHAFQQEGRYAEAIYAYQEVLSRQPENEIALVNIGSALQADKRWDEALTIFQKALSLYPRNAEAHNNLGVVLLLKNELDAAEAALRQALSLYPHYADAHNNLGSVLLSRGQGEAAVASFRAASTLKPHFSSAHFNEGAALLLAGDFAQGWPKYEHRFAATRRILPHANRRRWQKDLPLAGKSILVHAEQGLGDTLQFIRYVSMLSLQGATVSLQVQPALAPLLENFGGARLVKTDEEILAPTDYECPLLSLPFAFGTELATIPAPSGYLTAPKDLVAAWRECTRSPPGSRVGVVWSGNPRHENDHNRSVSLETFSPLFSAPGINIFSLNKELPLEDRIALARWPQLVEVGSRFNDLLDTAAFISTLDLVVTVDTSIAHLAGALGKPVWILLPFAPDWRWLRNREDSPWYPSARLFRQEIPGHWDATITRVREELSFLRTES